MYSLNFYFWMTFINVQFTLNHWKECNFNSVSHIVETGYLDMGMTSVKTLHALNILKVISEVIGQTWWRHLWLISILTFVKYFKLFFIKIYYSVMNDEERNGCVHLMHKILLLAPFQTQLMSGYDKY